MITKASIKARLESFPRVYLALLKFKRIGHWSQEWIVSSGSDVTIEGFPRSANSFALSAFRLAQSKPCRIATHVHSHAQIVRSVQLGVPTMVLFRPPKDACLSLAALTCQIGDMDVTDETVGQAMPVLAGHLIQYCRFYREVLSRIDQLVLAEFGLVTRDYGRLIQRLNRRFDTDFDLYANTEENRERIFQESGFHLSPDPKRDIIKEVLRRAYALDELRPGISAAEALYNELLAMESRQARQLDPKQA